MTEQQGMTMDRWLKFAQFGVALIALIGALMYAGQRTERDEHQSRSLDLMASELRQIRDAATEGNAQIRILGERVRGLEERTSRLERR